MIAATDDDEILGVYIVGPMAGELIAGRCSLEVLGQHRDPARTIHAHPTLSEALHGGARGGQARAIDMPNR